MASVADALYVDLTMGMAVRAVDGYLSRRSLDALYANQQQRYVGRREENVGIGGMTDLHNFDITRFD